MMSKYEKDTKEFMQITILKATFCKKCRSIE